MMTRVSCLLAIILLSVRLVWAEDFIIQETVINGQTIHYVIPLPNKQGEVLSYPIESERSVFRLYTMYKADSGPPTPLLLDTSSVGSYVPRAKVVISSIDPHVPARTRVDQPFGVEVEVEGLSADPSLPLIARKVKAVRSFKLYERETMNCAPEDPGKDYQPPFILSKNQRFALGDGNPQGGLLPRLDLLENPESLLMGEEAFTIYQGDATMTGDKLAAASIQIWPVASAYFLNLEADKVYQTIPSTAAVHCRDLYPGCEVFTQIFPAEDRTAAVRIPSASLQYSAETREPQTQRFPLNDLAKFVTKSGRYTIEVMTVTPFNQGKPELVPGGSISFEVKTSLRVRAGIYTLE